MTYSRESHQLQRMLVLYLGLEKWLLLLQLLELAREKQAERCGHFLPIFFS